MTDAPLVTYEGDVYSTSGYARAVRANIRAMMEVGVQIKVKPARYDDITVVYDDWWMRNQPKMVSEVGGPPKIRIQHKTPDLYTFEPGTKNIGYTVCETDRIVDWDASGKPNSSWVHQLNRCDRAWTGSEFCKEAFIRSGVKVPIDVFPHPINLDFYKPGSKALIDLDPSNKMPSDCMVFLAVFQWNPRKDPVSLMLAWWAEFRTDPKAQLILKTYAHNHTDKEAITSQIKRYKAEAFVRGDCRNVRVLVTQVSEQDMVEIYRSADVMISTSLGEGFGLPLQEAGACGIPAIYPNSTAMPEFCRGFPVRTFKEPAHGVGTPWYSIEMNWWRCDVEDLRRQMRRARHMWEHDRTAWQVLRDQSRDAVMSHGYQEQGGRMRAILEGMSA